DANHQIGSSLVHHRLPLVSIAANVLKDNERWLKELNVAFSSPRGRVSLGGQGRADVLEPASEEVFLVAVMRIEGRPADICPVEDVLDRDGVVALLLDERGKGASKQLTRSAHTPISLRQAHHRPLFLNN